MYDFNCTPRSSHIALRGNVWCHVLHRSHYISRFLTRPWEDERRLLTYADLETGVVRRKSSKSLFVTPDGFDTEMERLFSDYVEAPVGGLRKRWLDQGRRPDFDSWAEYRGLFLLLQLQGARVAELTGRVTVPTGLDLLREREETIDAYMACVHDQYQLVTTVLPRNLGLLIPETGFFVFFVPDRGCATGCTLAAGMALHPRIVVAVVSKTVTEDVLEWHSSFPAHIATLSAGTSSRVRRVVLPPGVRHAERGTSIATDVRQMIHRNRELMRRTFQLRAEMIARWQSAGMSLRERDVGDRPNLPWTSDRRLSPPKLS